MHSSEHFDFTMTYLSPSKTRKITTLHLMEIIRIKAVLTKLLDDVVRRIIEKSIRKIMINIRHATIKSSLNGVMDFNRSILTQSVLMIQ